MALSETSVQSMKKEKKRVTITMDSQQTPRTKVTLTKFENKTPTHKKRKPQVTLEQLTQVCTHLFSDADDDGAGTIDVAEAKSFCEGLLLARYPGTEFDVEKFKTGFNQIDDDKSGQIDFKELVLVIAENVRR